MSAATLARVRNPKNQLLQIDSSTIVGFSLYPIVRSTMKPDAQLLSSQKYRFLYLTRHKIYF